MIAWVLQGLLGAAFLAAGAMKLVKTREELLAEGARMAWVEDFSGSTLRTIGALEVAAGVGLILTHCRRGEKQMLMGNAMIALVAVIVAVGRFGDL